MTTKEFIVIIEQSQNGTYIATVPDLPGCYTQGDTLNEVNDYIIDAIKLYLEVKPEMIDEDDDPINFVGVEKITVEV